MEKVVRVDDIVHSLGLKVVAGHGSLNKEIILAELYHPGLELTGWKMEQDNENSKGIHIFGNKESSYIDSLNKRERHRNLETYMSYDFPCIVFPKEVKIPKDLLEIANVNQKVVLISKRNSSYFTKKIKKFLNEMMGPELILNHFSFLEIFGTGVLIAGDSDFRIGTLVELLRKKHRLIADGMVNVRRITSDYVVGEPIAFGEKKQYFIELSNVNKIDVTNFFGIGSIKPAKAIELIIKLSDWKDDFPYDRIGDSLLKQYLLGVEVPKLILPIKKGRNVSTIIEVAAMNRRLQKREKSSSTVFMDKLKKLIKKNEVVIHKGEAINIKELKRKFIATSLTKFEGLEEIYTSSTEVYRPSIEFSKGFKDERMVKGKIQVISEIEINYLKSLNRKELLKVLNEYFSIPFPCVIICSNKKFEFKELIEKAIEKKVILLHSKKEISNLMLDLSEFLDVRLAPSETSHGVFVEVFGVGVFITGRSGIGKSETALELIHRGHRLVSDDAVQFKKMKDGRILGATSKIPYFMEIRGLGIIDVKTLYGLGSVKHSKELDLVIELMEGSDGNLDYNYRESTFSVLGKSIKKINFYVTPGRNISSIIEILTMRYRQKHSTVRGSEINDK